MSKLHITILFFIMIILFSGCSNEQIKVLSVKDVIDTPQPFAAVSIVGVVASVSPYESKTFTLMDIEDARNSKPNRDTYYLKVVSGRRVPKAGETVKVTGHLTEHGLYFVADAVRRHRI